MCTNSVCVPLNPEPYVPTHTSAVASDASRHEAWCWAAGPNGAGKSTLLRLIMGREQPISGRVELGAHGIVPNYFEQNQVTPLNPRIEPPADRQPHCGLVTSHPPWEPLHRRPGLALFHIAVQTCAISCCAACCD